MIYKGTFPGRPTAPDVFNAVDVGDTGRGKVARQLVGQGKNAGRRRRPAQAWHWLAAYWSFVMPVADKNYWREQFKDAFYISRAGGEGPFTGFAQFLISNTAALCLDQNPISVPPLDTDNFVPTFEPHSISAATNKLKIFCFFNGWNPEIWFAEFFVSVIRPGNLHQGDPLKNTELIGTIKPNESVGGGDPPSIPQYLALPWAVDVGNVVGVYAADRWGAQNFPPGYYAGAHFEAWWEITVT